MDKIKELLTRGVEQIIPSKKELEKILRSGKKLRVYQGFDPSSEKLHIGHLIGLRKLRQWQDLGHEVIFLIGDFTGRIGDPTGKEETRPLLSKERVEKNAKTYKEQAGKILRFKGQNPVIVKFNSEWLEKLSMQEVLNLAAQITYQQIIKRDLYQRRLEKDQDISINEILYPITQGYDSVVMDVDVEVGGRDQLFNMMIGRQLMHKMKRKNKFVMTTELLTDSQGIKIGKTEGNVIALTDPPEEMFGSIMNFPDDAIIKGLECLTDTPQEEIESIKTTIASGQNPLQSKKKLAYEVIKQLDGEEAAKRAQEDFERVFQKGQLPKDFLEIKTTDKISASEVIARIVGSKSEAKRLFQQGAIEIDDKTENNPKIKLKSGQIVKIGKKKFVRVKVQEVR